jgi:hypothetical protein
MSSSIARTIDEIFVSPEASFFVVFLERVGRSQKMGKLQRLYTVEDVRRYLIQLGYEN